MEFQRAARNMEGLRQWAGLTGGVAVKAEDCDDAGQLIAQIKAQVEPAEILFVADAMTGQDAVTVAEPVMPSKPCTKKFAFICPLETNTSINSLPAVELFGETNTLVGSSL